MYVRVVDTGHGVGESERRSGTGQRERERENFIFQLVSDCRNFSIRKN